jgi:hypothetical protein
MAMPWLRQLVISLSLRRPGSVHVGFEVDKVAPGQVFLQVMFSPVNIILPWLSVLITAFLAAVQRHLTPININSNTNKLKHNLNIELIKFQLSGIGVDWCGFTDQYL